ncbi:MAG: DHA1 family bicyclomycin/chloramphenicol resistance-like MFS transporter [Phenylobacterium sp.]
MLNGKFVMRLGMFRLVMSAWSCLIVVSGCLLLAGFSNEGVPPFFAFVVACFLVFFCLGILFGNMSSMAMQSLGENAGLGASMVGSMSGLLGVLLSMVIGQFYNQTIFPLAVGYIVLASCALGLVMVAQWVVKE